MYLIISTLEKSDEDAERIIHKLKQKSEDIEVIYAKDLNIKGCIGCNHCWLVTPGICTIKDDHETLLIKFLQAKQVVFLTESKLGFVSYQLKNIVDRLLPLATMYLRFENGQMRHYPRYNKRYKMGLIYKGNGNQEILEKWFERTMLNINGTSLGAYRMEDNEGIVNELIND